MVLAFSWLAGRGLRGPDPLVASGLDGPSHIVPGDGSRGPDPLSACDCSRGHGPLVAGALRCPLVTGDGWGCLRLPITGDGSGGSNPLVDGCLDGPGDGSGGLCPLEVDEGPGSPDPLDGAGLEGSAPPLDNGFGCSVYHMAGGGTGGPCPPLNLYAHASSEQYLDRMGASLDRRAAAKAASDNAAQK